MCDTPFFLTPFKIAIFLVKNGNIWAETNWNIKNFGNFGSTIYTTQKCGKVTTPIICDRVPEEPQEPQEPLDDRGFQEYGPFSLRIPEERGTYEIVPACVTKKIAMWHFL